VSVFIAAALRPFIALLLLFIAAIIARKIIEPLIPEGRIKRLLFKRIG
jgi:hypothetical protein